MKALLKTRCGCTQLIDIIQLQPCIKVPLYLPEAAHHIGNGTEIPDASVKWRDFHLTRHCNTFFNIVDVYLYEERT
jgi:hypothetical protein